MKTKRNLFLLFCLLLVIGAYQNCSPTGLSVTDPSSSANGDNTNQGTGPITKSTVYKLANPNITVQPGQSATLAMRFYGVPMDANYQVFVHFVSSSGTQLPFGGDHAPSVPTASWSGNVSYDRSITVPINTPAGTYSIKVGLYENAPPYLNRATLGTGTGVTVDGEKRYTVGQLTVSGSTDPGPVPGPGPGPDPGTGAGPFGQDASQYVPTFSDEFNNGFNTAVWNDHIWYETSNPTKNYTVEDGKLKIWPQRDASGNFFNRTIDTDGKYYQTYGYFEIDAKLPVGRGTWPAFWLFNHIGSRRPEMDVMEAYAGGAAPWGFDVNGIPHPQAYAPTVWKGDQEGQLVGTRQYDTGLDLSAGFHKYAVRWEPNRQIYYFDGKEVLTLNTSFPDPMYLMLDLWYGSASGTPNPTNTPEGKSNSFEVNYIRAWRFK